MVKRVKGEGHNWKKNFDYECAPSKRPHKKQATEKRDQEEGPLPQLIPNVNHVRESDKQLMQTIHDKEEDE